MTAPRKVSVLILTVIVMVTSGCQGEELKRQKRSVDVDAPNHVLKNSSELPTKPDIHAASGSGSTYVRWGRNICPSHSELVYSGVAGGSFYDQAGGGSNYLCLTLQPIWGDYNDAVAGYSPVHGAEYETGWPLQSDNIDGNNHVEHDVPCAVCLTKGRATNVMIPGRNECLGDGWTLEYHGYLMSAHHAHKRTEFACMDAAPEADPAGYENKNGALFYYSEATCGSLPCPPYVNGRELTCAVCSK